MQDGFPAFIRLSAVADFAGDPNGPQSLILG